MTVCEEVEWHSSHGFYIHCQCKCVCSACNSYFFAFAVKRIWLRARTSMGSWPIFSIHIFLFKAFFSLYSLIKISYVQQRRAQTAQTHIAESSWWMCDTHFIIRFFCPHIRIWHIYFDSNFCLIVLSFIGILHGMMSESYMWGAGEPSPFCEKNTKIYWNALFSVFVFLNL